MTTMGELQRQAQPLTREETSCLKTALAVVVLRRRFELQRQNEESKVPELPLFVRGSLEKESLLAQRCSHPHSWSDHLQHTVNMAVHLLLANTPTTAPPQVPGQDRLILPSSKSTGQRNLRLKSLVMHLACQLQELSTTTHHENNQSHQLEDWIRKSLTTVPNNMADFAANGLSTVIQVWRGVLEARPEAMSSILSLPLAKLVLDLARGGLAAEGDLLEQSIRHLELLEECIEVASDETRQQVCQTLLDHAQQTVHMSSLSDWMQAVATAPSAKTVVLRWGLTNILKGLLASTCDTKMLD